MASSATGDTPWALGDNNYHLTGSYHMGGDKIRWWCTLGSAVCVSAQLPWALGVQLRCCNSLITGDTPWALGDDNYHLTGSYSMGGDKIRWWCTLGSAICVAAPSCHGPMARSGCIMIIIAAFWFFSSHFAFDSLSRDENLATVTVCIQIS